MQARKSRGPLQLGATILASLMLFSTRPTEGQRYGVQTHDRRPNAVDESSMAGEASHIVERAIDVICSERLQDSHGSFAIDEMAAQDSMPLNDPQVKEGRKRAERLLSEAKKLVPAVLKRLAAAHDLEPLNPDWIAARVKAVNTIKPEVGKHDNAAWRASEPQAIIFGTVFLVGLRSDEAMITVLAHELTHAVNGTDQALQPLFARVNARAARAGNFSMRAAMAIELTCELVGIGVMQEFAGRRSVKEGLRRRLTRAFGKDCVQQDLADENHLSPRQTMRLLLTLDPALTRTIVGAEKREHPKGEKRSKERHLDSKTQLLSRPR